LIINATGGSIAQSGANRQFGILGTVNFNTGGTGVTLGGQLENRTLFFRNGSTIGGDAANVNISRSSVTIESGVTINYGGSFTLVGTTQTATHFSLLNLGNGIDLSSTGSNNTIILSNVSTSQKIVQAAANGTATVGDIVIQQANNAQARLAAGTNGTLNVNGVISQNAAGRTLNIQGEGTVVLNNANTYTGATNVNAGTLLINGNISTSSLTTVASGATLGGIGTLGALTVQDNGTLAPGTSPGTLSSGTLTLADLSNLNFEINPLDFTTGGGINDLVSVTGNLSLDGILNLTSTSGDFLSAIEGDAWRLFNYSGSLTDNGLALGTMPALGSGLGWDIDTATAGQVNLVVIPEPSVALLGGLGLLALLRRRR
jgi:fibronectin-binding autotransporter adhesin